MTVTPRLTLASAMSRKRSSLAQKQPAASSSRRRSFFLALVLALLWAQSLGLAHRVLHPSIKAAQAKSVTSVAAEGTALRAGLFAHFEGAPGDQAADCRLLDQLSHEQPVLPALPVIATVFPFVFENIYLSDAFEQTFRAHYAARAPPAIL